MVAEPNVMGVEAPTKERWHLSGFAIAGFKSIEKVEFGLRGINVLIGANGSGKSNLIGAFHMLARMMDSVGRLREYVGISGGASRLLHFGPKVTQRIQIELDFRPSDAPPRVLRYRAVLVIASDETLVFEREASRLDQHGYEHSFQWDALGEELGTGHTESRLTHAPAETAKAILAIIRGIRIFQFHDSSSTSNLRVNSNVHDARFVRGSGGQLPTVLKRIKEQDPPRFEMICGFIRLIYPAFLDFEFLPVGESALRLGWRERLSDYVFDVSQASDGTVRFFALATILLSNPSELPPIIILDEPELGLHPAALSVLADMIRIAAQQSQVIVATQSTYLVDQFDLTDIVVVERRGGKSTFDRFSPERYKPWLEEFEGEPGEALSSLWERGVIGGMPSI